MNIDQWLARYGQAWRDKDAYAAAGLFTEDGVYLSSPTAPAHVGSDAIAAYWRRATATQQEVDLRFGLPVINGRRVAVEWWAVMRDADWQPDAPSDWVTLPGCLILRFAEDGLCEELREYYNPVFGEALQPPTGWGR
ncbi:nuclear transport factor 2 family protein [Nonomuraea sp. NPDC049709]|uniref:nuclear transport factor 2 family protein n=1 Tax=Nonomuraea sp. NPDC049709 TaxID=3154736 RepID=UPI003437F351